MIPLEDLSGLNKKSVVYSDPYQEQSNDYLSEVSETLRNVFEYPF